MASSSFLDAFEALGEAVDPADQVSVLPMSLIDEDPDNPRQTFDDAEIEALAATLTSQGLLQPIIVRPVDAQGRYRLRFGARRFRAARLAGFSDIRAIIRVGRNDPLEDLLEQLIENDQREGLSVAELARAVDRLLEGGLSQSAIADRLGRPKPQISMLAQVRSMPPELQELAPRLGLRTLSELNVAWRADPARVRNWLKGRPPEAITQAEARELAGRPVPTRQVVRDPSDGSVREVGGGSGSAARTGRPRAPAPEPSAPTQAPPPGAAVFEVKARGIKGVLVLDNVSHPSAGVRVRLSDDSVVPVPAAKIQIVRVRPG